MTYQTTYKDDIIKQSLAIENERMNETLINLDTLASIVQLVYSNTPADVVQDVNLEEASSPKYRKRDLQFTNIICSTTRTSTQVKSGQSANTIWPDKCMMLTSDCR